MAVLILCAVCAAPAASALAPQPPSSRTALEPFRHARWEFGGELGKRIDRNIENWILRAPDANPGLLDMFRRRDRRQPFAEHTPWAGEFAGKYLISAVQAYRIKPSPKLQKHVASFVADLIATQAADGYLGPWPAGRQLMRDCDLWGHYHCMLGLLMWADDTGDRKAYESVIRAADCICRLYVDGGRRPIEAGNPCFNLSVLHIIAELQRRAPNDRYLALIRRIEEDMEKDGDWLRGGVNGTPYWRLPSSGPRWEALHILQGFVTLWEATGEERYRRAVLNHWRSIRDLDRHPSGAFSTNEQASGTIFAQGAIETCCSVAWMALTTDVMRLTGDSTVADELELTLWNQALAAQHPSGNWCTYDTPLNGVRAPSYHQINFQYRPGSPELNCCSVNSPRTLGMLPDWAVMRPASADGGAPSVTLNYYGPGVFHAPIGGKRPMRLTQKTDYPADGLVRIEPDAGGKEVELRLRIPAWSRTTTIRVNGKAPARTVQPGEYLSLKRKWSKGDAIELRLDMTPRLTLGEGPDRGGQAAIHMGPLLLAFDAGLNPIETPDLMPMDVRNVSLERLSKRECASTIGKLPFPPMGLWRTQTEGGPVLLCDFASAGARGTDYAAWLPVSHASPAPVRLSLPADGERGRPGPILFRWTSTGAPGDTYRLTIARDVDFRSIVASVEGVSDTHATVKAGMEEAGAYYWKVEARNAFGATENRDGPRTFRVDETAANPFLVVRDDGCIAASLLSGSAEPTCGALTHEAGVQPTDGPQGNASGALEFNGAESGLRYRLPFAPEMSYSFAAWIRPSAEMSGMGQVFSAWCRGMDDPLRVTFEGGEITARIEAGGGWRTAGAKVPPDRWAHVAAVKDGASLRLYLDGVEIGAVQVPERIHSQAQEIGIGFNPFFSGGERYRGAIADFAFYARALTPEEIAAASRSEGG